MFKNFFKKKTIDLKVTIALVLIIGSNLGWLLPITLIPWLNLPVKTKAILSSISIVMGHVTYNLGLFLVGERIVRQLKKKNINLQWLWNQAKVFVQVLKHLVRHRKFPTTKKIKK